MKRGRLKLIKDGENSFDEVVEVLSFYMNYPILQCASIVNIMDTKGESELMVGDIYYLEELSEILMKHGLSITLEIFESEQ